MGTEAFVIVSPDYPPHMGGVERYAWYLAGELKRRGHSVFVVSSSMTQVPRISRDDRGITVLRFPSIWLIPDRMPVPLPTGMWGKLAKELEHFDSVKLIAQTNLYLLCLNSLRFADNHQIKSMMIIHGSNYVCLGKSVIDKAEHKYEEWILSRARKRNVIFASVSEASKEFATGFGCEVKTIAYNAIDFSEIDRINAASIVSAREKYCLRQTTGIITFVGRIIREKGVFQLTEAFRRVYTDKDDIVLLIIGNGPLLTELKKENDKKVILTGQLPHQDVIAFLNQSDCFILPSDSEGFPTTILEAAACGCYVISAPYGGQKEATQLVNGFVMEDNSVESICQALNYYNENAGYLSEQAEEGKKRLRREASWQKTTDKIVEAFKENE